MLVGSGAWERYNGITPVQEECLRNPFNCGAIIELCRHLVVVVQLESGEEYFTDRR